MLRDKWFVARVFGIRKLAQRHLRGMGERFQTSEKPSPITRCSLPEVYRRLS